MRFFQRWQFSSVMWSLTSLAIGLSLLWQGVSEDLDSSNQNISSTDACNRIGRKFCGLAGCIIAGDERDTFECNCGKDKYYDATDGRCKHRDSCQLKPCKVGVCSDFNGLNARNCTCEKHDYLTRTCEIAEFRKRECEELRAQATITEDGNVVCSCYEGAFWKPYRHGVICKGLVKPTVSPCQDSEIQGADGRCQQRTECTETEKMRCRAGEICNFWISEPICHCGTRGRPVGGACTEKCHANTCFQNMSVCTVSYGKDACTCKPPLTRAGGTNSKCSLEHYAYRVTFQAMNVAYNGTDTCRQEEIELAKAMRTLFGKGVRSVELLDCRTNINENQIFNNRKNVRIRLTMTSKQDPAFLNRLQLCTLEEGAYCFFPPTLRVRRYTVQDIEEEDLCEDFLQNMLGFPGGPERCWKVGDNYVLHCKNGLAAHSPKRAGRLSMWFCSGNKADKIREILVLTPVLAGALVIRTLI